MTECKNIKTVPKEWFGEIPSNWTSQRIKTLFDMRDERSYLPLSEVNLISLYTSTGVHQHSDIEHTTGNKARNADGYKIVAKDDIVVNILLCWMGAIGRSDYNGVTSPAYDIYIPKCGVNSKYYHYLFRTSLFSQQCYKAGKGIMSMRWRTYSPQFRNIVVPVPPLSEQDQIVRFLDWKTSRINSLINVKKKECAELNEMKKISINKSVTGGLNSRITKKKSNIDFAKNIPTHWKCMKLKSCCKILNGSDPSLQGNIPVYGSGSGIVKFCGEFKEGPVILLGRKGTLNKPKIIYGKFWNVDTAMDMYVKDNMDIKYMFYVSTLFDIEKYSTCTAKPSMTQTDYYNMTIPVPPKFEQEEIASYLDFRIVKIDCIIKTKLDEIQMLQDLKNRLVLDVVTGKIDVCNVEIPDYEYIEEENDIADDIEDNEELTEEE